MDKTKNAIIITVSIILGSCIICVGNYFIVRNNLEKIYPVEVSLLNPGYSELNNSKEYDDFLSIYQLQSFLKVADTESLMDMINSGELDGTYINIQGKYIFSKEKIIDWANKKMEK